MNKQADFANSISGAIFGLLVGDALGLPYEFGRIRRIPNKRPLEMSEIKQRLRSHPVASGTWSDDGAAALTLLDSIARKGRLDTNDAAKGLLAWMIQGRMSVDGHVFDVGIQTTEALSRFQRGIPPEECGLSGERNNGNGSLMRVISTALCPYASDQQIVADATAQSRITHAHPRSLVCCALYALWVRRELEAAPGRPRSEECWKRAVWKLRILLPKECAEREELERHIRPDAPAWGTGSGYVIDSLQSARWACQADSYEEIVTRAIALGNDTDTTASLAGGIAGLRHGVSGIPERWMTALRGKELVVGILDDFTQSAGRRPPL